MPQVIDITFGFELQDIPAPIFGAGENHVTNCIVLRDQLYKNMSSGKTDSQ